MPPVSSVFQTVEAVRIGLKTQLEWEHPFHRRIPDRGTGHYLNNNGEQN